MFRKFIISLAVLLIVIIYFEVSGIDIWFQDHLYDFSSKAWLLDRNNSLARLLFYDGIKMLLISFYLGILLTLLVFRKKEIIQRYRTGLLIVLISGIIVPAVTGELKSVTNIPCPCNINRYNGDTPYVTFLGRYPANYTQHEKARCFPAGHASGGFALLSLFFLFRKRKNQIIAVVLAMATGWSMGTYKMLIGDHFLSHTIVSMLLAWILIIMVAGVLREKSKKWNCQCPDQYKHSAR